MTMPSDDATDIVSLMNSIIIRDRLCALELASRMGRAGPVPYKQVQLSRVRSIVQRMKVKGSAHRAARHGVFDRSEIERILEKSYNNIIEAFQRERSNSRLINLFLLQVPVYEHDVDEYVYSFILDFEEGA